MTKSWKDLLLSSGLPLEYSVGRVLQSLTGWAATEFKYRRAAEDGALKVFSIDAASTHINSRDDIWLELLVECKYRHDGTRWVFALLDSLHSQPAIIAVDQASDVGRVRTEILNEAVAPFPLCGKGVELLDRDANPKSIEQAIQQLRYAVAPQVVEALNHQAGHWLGSVSPVFLLVPVVVTTAELWCMRADVSVEDVRAATEVSDVCERCEALVLEQLPDDMQRDYTTSVFDEQMDEEVFDLLNDVLTSRGAGDAPSLVAQLAHHVPSRFLVVEYAAFGAFATRLHQRVEREDLLEAWAIPG